MRRRSSLAMFAMCIALAGTGAAEQPQTSSLVYVSLPNLEEHLADLAEAALVDREIRLERDTVRVVTSRPLSPGEHLRIEALWAANRIPSQLPMQFDMRPVDAGTGALPVRAVLSAVLVRDAWVTTRMLRKGSPIGCADFELEPRKLMSIPKGALSRKCSLTEGSVALRDLGRREIVRDGDAGQAPLVSAFAPVTLSVVQGLITIDTQAVALADAHDGETLKVRLANPRRVVQARVNGPGRVSLLEQP